ncbi:MAG: tetrahydrofolate dehydrogenase/cyclohydrolase catalytic domain-containing protein, partial [Betaproteobacteria bacterium]
MTARIIDGKARAERLTADIKDAVSARVAAGKAPPGLAVVLVGDDPASQVYVRNKRRTTEATGMRSFAHDLAATTSKADLLALVDALNRDPAVTGILVQLPLPKHIDEEAVTERIDPLKDVDGFHPYNIGRLVLKRPTLRPCTPYGCMTLLKDTGEDLVGKHAV